MVPHRIRQEKPYRTRIQFPCFKGQPRRCAFIAEKLARIPGVEQVEVRWKTGSAILVHREVFVGVAPVLKMVSGLVSKRDALTAGQAEDCGEKPPASVPAHRSGTVLVLTGVYIGSLIFRRLLGVPMVTGVWVRRLVSIPFFWALFLAWPVQKEAVKRFKQTREVDLGLISAALLGFSFLTGNILTALIVAWLFNLSAWLETRIKRRTRQTIRQMLTGDIRQVWQLVDGVEIQRDLDDILPGDILVLQEGDRVSVDGRIVRGSGLVNEASMTGESLSVHKAEKDSVLAGTVLEQGQIQVRVEKTGRDTRLAAIIRLIETAETDSGELSGLGQQLSRTMVPVSLMVAGTVFLLTGNFFQAVTLIMITCPCALRLSSSVAVSVAMGQAASEGILFKGGSHVEAAGQVSVLALDKTGTLTEDNARISRVELLDRRFGEKTLLRYAAAALKTVPHPLSRAVADEAERRQLDLPHVKTRRRFTGQGVSATVDNRRVLAGSLAFLSENGIDVTRASTNGKDPVSARDSSPDSQVYVALDNRLTGCILVASRNRKDTTPESIRRLRQAGIRHIALLTGDNRQAAEQLKTDLGQAGLGVDEVHWQMSPEDKAAWVARRKRDNLGDLVAVAGDGINDTPAFATGDLSIAVGDSGADAAVEYADVVLQQGGMGGVARTMEIGRDTVDTIRRSYFMTVSLNLAALGLTAFGLVPPLTGALLHNLVTAYAVAKAARIPEKHTAPVLTEAPVPTESKNKFKE